MLPYLQHDLVFLECNSIDYIYMPNFIKNLLNSQSKSVHLLIRICPSVATMNIGTDIIQSHILVSSSRFSLKITEKNTLVKNFVKS